MSMSDQSTDDRDNPETIAVTHGIASDAAWGAVTPPLYMSSTYAFPGFQQGGPYEYGRSGNPTRDMLGQALARLEGGASAVVTASGMAAIDLLLAQLRPEDAVIAPHDCYGGSMRLLKARAARGHLRVRFVDYGDGAALDAALADGAALLLIETPSNPLMRVTDIAALAARCRAAGVKVAVDNTFLSPALQSPIALGADYVLHSTTKYINGHSDVVGGAVISADAGDGEALTHWANVAGAIGSPFDAWLTLRGLRTLYPRMRQQEQNAQAVARFLEAHPAVKRVHYPGLPSHPGHDVAQCQQRGFGAMLSFELAGGAGAVRSFLEGVKVFVLAESLGGTESLVAHPASMTHCDMGAEARRIAGIEDGLLRLSVGLEHEADLLAGLDSGLRACQEVCNHHV
jgi:cystathionine gamma-synthase